MAALVVHTHPIQAQRDVNAESQANAETPGSKESEPKPPSIEDRGDGVFALGEIEIDTTRREVRFPAVVHKPDIALEYSVVGRGGKTHETLFVTKIRPSEIHFAKLLLFGEARKPVVKPQVSPGTFAEMTGDLVDVLVEWREESGAKKEVRLESLIQNQLTQQQAKPGPWLYNGSRVIDGVFQAETDKVIFAVFDDPFALINNPRAGHDNDEIWVPNWDLAPEPETPVTLKIRRPESPEKGRIVTDPEKIDANRQ